VFGRSPDLPGENGWTGALNSNTLSLDQVAMGFVASPEFQNMYGSMNNTQFIETLYQNVLGRQAEPAGLAGWQFAMSNGETRDQVLLGFTDSIEHKQDTISTIGDKDLSEAYRLYGTFNRTPDRPGLDGWTAQLDSGAIPLQVAQGFVDSTEFQQMFGGLDTTSLVNDLYQNVLHRAADSAGEQGWINQLNGGASLASVVLGFSDSAEHRAMTAAATHDSWAFVPTSCIDMGNEPRWVPPPVRP
jgi:hypothetical protein